MDFLRSRLAGITIRTKLSAGFGLALILVILTGAFSVGQISQLNRFATDITARWLPEMETLAELRHALAEHRILATGRTQTTNYRQLAAISEAMRGAEEKLDDAQEAYLEVAHTDAEREGLATFAARYGAYRESLDHAFARLDSGDPSGGQSIFDTETLPLHQNAATILEELVVASKQEGLNATAEARSLYETSLLIMLAVVGAGVAMVMAAIYWISRSISTPILKISAAMDRLSAGENIELPEGGDRKDEIGTLVAAATAYRDSLQRSRTLAAETEAHRVRFAAAIDNMPVGLSMFDAKGGLIVSNGRYGAMYGLPDELTKPGAHYHSINSKLIDLGFKVTGSSAAGCDQVLEPNLDERAVSLTEAGDGRTFSVVRQQMAGGGWVSTHEDITERRRDEARITHMARHDALTDLPNRTAFKDRLEEVLDELDDGQAAVLCLDLDRFKAVNDTLGHPIGDGLLKIVAERLVTCIRDTDMVSRLGGDEFAIIQAGAMQPDASRALAQRIIDTLSRPYVIDGHQVVVGTSIGIAVAPCDGRRADVLMKNGDIALYRAKSDGKGVYRFFEQGMDAAMQQRRNLELDLRVALERGEFELHYQPLASMATGGINGFEALLRWRHPERGMILPGEFIPTAEEIGLIVPIGEWVLKEACREAADWPKNMHLAVNLSPVQFRSDRLVDAVSEALSVSGFAPDRLELEITETLFLADSDSVLATLHQLKALGVHISMDDFGTGYSSLSYLRSFPFDKIKIDRSFIRDMAEPGNAMAIIRAVSGLGASLGMRTVAEGVETAAQLESLRLEGYTEAQGYLISRPVPAGSIKALLAKLAVNETQLGKLKTANFGRPLMIAK